MGSMGNCWRADLFLGPRMSWICCIIYIYILDYLNLFAVVLYFDDFWVGTLLMFSDVWSLIATCMPSRF